MASVASRAAVLLRASWAGSQTPLFPVGTVPKALHPALPRTSTPSHAAVTRDGELMPTGVDAERDDRPRRGVAVDDGSSLSRCPFVDNGRSDGLHADRHARQAGTQRRDVPFGLSPQIGWNVGASLGQVLLKCAIASASRSRCSSHTPMAGAPGNCPTRRSRPGTTPGLLRTWARASPGGS